MGKRMTRQYDMEFKLSAVELVEKQGYSVPEAAKSLGISKSNLYTWRRQYLQGRLAPGHKRAQATPEEAELRRLREENKRLKMEAEILKKASAYFARQLG
jgi:transposase